MPQDLKIPVKLQTMQGTGFFEIKGDRNDRNSKELSDLSAFQWQIKYRINNCYIIPKERMS